MPKSVRLSGAVALREEYYAQTNALKSPEDFSAVIYHQRPGGFAPVLKPLLPERIPFGSSYRELIAHMGEPRYVLSNEHQVSGHQVAFYRRNMGPYMMSLQFHLFRGRLTYVECRFLENGAKKGPAQQILHALIRRYAGAGPEENAFQDGNGNRLWIESGDHMVLHYLSGDSSLKSAFPKPGKFRYQRPAKRSHLGWLRDSA